MGVWIAGDRLRIDGNANGTRQPVDECVSKIASVTSKPDYEEGRVGVYDVRINKKGGGYVARRLNHFDYKSVRQLLRIGRGGAIK